MNGGAWKFFRHSVDPPIQLMIRAMSNAVDSWDLKLASTMNVIPALKIIHRLPGSCLDVAWRDISKDQRNNNEPA